MQNRSIFPYRRHGPKKRVKHGSHRKERGPRKGLPNSARDLLPLLQPATKALAQVLAGRAGASGQLGHARSMLAQAERMIAERAHNRLTPAEREEFFEQLARLKLTLADAEVEAEVQAVEQHEPKPQAAPVAQERLKEMALALAGREAQRDAGRERPGPSGAVASPSGQEDEERATPSDMASDQPPEVVPEIEDERPQPAPAAGSGAGAPGQGAAARGRLVLPKASADQAVQALAYGSLARRRTRASNRAADAAFSSFGSRPGGEPARDRDSDEIGRAPAADDAAAPPRGHASQPDSGVETPDAAADEPQHGAASSSHAAPHDADDDVPEPHRGNGGAAPESEPAPAKTARRGRRPKRQGLPEGWVIDEEGFVVPGAD